MISAMPAVAVRRGRKRSKTFGRFNLPNKKRGSTSNNSQGRRGPGSITTLGGGERAFLRRRGATMRFDTEVDRQRRRFLVYTGTLFLITGLLLVFIGVGSGVPTAQMVGLLLIGLGAALCIIKVFCSEAHMTDVPQKAAVIVEDPESNSCGNKKEGEADATPLTNISEFTAIPESESGTQEAAAAAAANAHQQNSVAPPNSVPETQILIGNDSGSRY